MKLTFCYTVRDRLAFAAYHFPRTPMTLLISVGFMLFVTFESVLPAMAKYKSAALQVGFLIYAEAMLALFIMVIWTVIILAGMFSSKDKALMSERTITLGGDCFISDTSFAHSEYKWPMVQKLGRTRRHIFLYLNKDSAVIIPRRAFENASHWDGFYDYCQSKTRRTA